MTLGGVNLEWMLDMEARIVLKLTPFTGVVPGYLGVIKIRHVFNLSQ